MGRKGIYSEWIEETGALTVQTLDFEIRQLETIYEFRNSHEVIDYLKAYPFLTELLFEAFPEVERFFGRSPRVVLKVVTDPEIEGENQLFAYIHTTLPPEETLNRMDRLDEEWFLNQINRTRGKFNIKVEVEEEQMIVEKEEGNIDLILEELFGDDLISPEEFAEVFKDWIKPDITFEQLDEMFNGKFLPIEEAIRKEREEREKYLRNGFHHEDEKNTAGEPECLLL